ncbi:MAG: azurin [Flavobacteriaceae bacterium]|nr:azurin [Flavobacteriaceae bacterium]
MKFSKTWIPLIALALFISCGGEKEKKSEESVKIGTKETPKETDKNSVTIGISGNDLMKFDTAEIKVKEGQEVTINLRHVGKLDLKVMGHNFVILKQGIDIPTFALAAANAGEPADWIPDNGKDVIVHTKMIGGGQSTSITFDAPPVGTYDFVCSFPGHSGMMKGKFIVE